MQCACVIFTHNCLSAAPSIFVFSQTSSKKNSQSPLWSPPIELHLHLGTIHISIECVIFFYVCNKPKHLKGGLLLCCYYLNRTRIIPRTLFAPYRKGESKKERDGGEGHFRETYTTLLPLSFVASLYRDTLPHTFHISRVPPSLRVKC